MNPITPPAAPGWAPEISAQRMCAEMVTEDLKIAQRHALLEAHGRRDAATEREAGLEASPR
jgi:GDPmannose 4,6-dehydratase